MIYPFFQERNYSLKLCKKNWYLGIPYLKYFESIFVKTKAFREIFFTNLLRIKSSTYGANFIKNSYPFSIQVCDEPHEKLTFSPHLIARNLNTGDEVTILACRVSLVLDHTTILIAPKFCVCEKCWSQYVIFHYKWQ